MGNMSGGMWVVLVIPAILAFLFGVWVFYNMVADVSQREESFYEIVGQDTVRLKVEPPE
jgi:ascorbate-specific PTS system EIIC-type component UlaA